MYTFYKVSKVRSSLSFCLIKRLYLGPDCENTAEVDMPLGTIF